MRRIRTAAVFAAVALLLPTAASAVALDPIQHFMLGQSPYLHDNADGEGAPGFDGDGTPIMTSGMDQNVPNVPVVDLSRQILVDPQEELFMDKWMLLTDGEDYELETTSPDLPNMGGTPAVANEVDINWTLTLDGGFTVPENATVTEGGKLLLLLVVWDLREGDTLSDILNAKSVIGGFDKDSFSGDLFGGPVIADAKNASPAVALPDIQIGDPNTGDPLGSPGIHIDQGLGLFFALDPGEMADFFSLYLAGQDLPSGPLLRPVTDLYWCKVPEPRVAALLLVAFVGLAVADRRRRA